MNRFSIQQCQWFIARIEKHFVTVLKPTPTQQHLASGAELLDFGQGFDIVLYLTAFIRIKIVLYSFTVVF